MSSKFASLAADVAQTYRLEIIDPVSQQVLKDKDGVVAFIDLYASDSEIGLAFDKEQRAVMRRKAMRSRNGMADGDQLEDNQNKCAALTKEWHLVNPATREPLDVPCTRESALELYSGAGMNWLFVQAWVAANEPANFMQRSSGS